MIVFPLPVLPLMACLQVIVTICQDIIIMLHTILASIRPDHATIFSGCCRVIQKKLERERERERD